MVPAKTSDTLFVFCESFVPVLQLFRLTFLTSQTLTAPSAEPLAKI